MAQINNSDVKKTLIDEAKINIVTEAVPSELGKTVVPVLIANPQRVCNFVMSNARSTTGDLVLGTTHATKDTYLTGVQVSWDKDAVCDNASANLRVVVGGETLRIQEYSFVLGTVDAKNLMVEFAVPFKLDKNTPITFVGSFTAGTLTRSGSAHGYTVEV